MKITMIHLISIIVLINGMLLSCSENNAFYLLNSALDNTSSNHSDQNNPEQNNTVSDINTLGTSIDNKNNINNNLVLTVNKNTDINKLISNLGITVEAILEIDNLSYIKISTTKSTKELLKDTEVLSIELDAKREIFTAPNDTHYSSQYVSSLQTELETIWENYTGKNVKVAVIDTGINTKHEDFGGSTTFEAGKDYTDNSISYKIDEHRDDNGHGTHIAGIIGARKNNGKGIVGIAPEVTIIPYRVTISTGTYLSSFYIASAIKEAANAGADVINMSFGGLGLSDVEGDAIQYAIERNVTLVAAIGNNGVHLKIYPASSPGVIAVGSINRKDEHSQFSNLSNLISVSAPGEQIISLKAGDGDNTSGYITYSGTSLSAPFVSGVVALLKHKHPNATPAQIKSILESTSLDLGDLGWDASYGHGKVSPQQALAETLPNDTWTKVEFEMNYEGHPIRNYIITLLGQDKTPLYNIITNTSGKAFAFLPPATYSFISGYYGISYNNSFTVENTKKIITKNLVEGDASDYYTLSTYNAQVSVDTILYLYKCNTATCENETLITYNDDKPSNITSSTSLTSKFSSIIFKAESGTTYRIKVKGGYSTTGYYRIILEKGIPAIEPTSTTGSTIDETNNDNKSNKENLTLTADAPRNGLIASSADIDFFLFTAP